MVVYMARGKFEFFPHCEGIDILFQEESLRGIENGLRGCLSRVDLGRVQCISLRKTTVLILDFEEFIEMKYMSSLSHLFIPSYELHSFTSSPFLRLYLFSASSN